MTKNNNYVVSAISPQRINSLSILLRESENTRKINLKTVLEAFAEKNF